MKLLVAVIFALLGVVSLAALRKPYGQRSARWGKRGIGPKMSALSIIVVSVWLLGLAAAMSASSFLNIVPPDLEITVVFSGFCAAVLCGVLDMIIESRLKKKEPIQPPQTTTGSSAPDRV